MDQATHNKIVSFIWGTADDVLHGGLPEDELEDEAPPASNESISKKRKA